MKITYSCWVLPLLVALLPYTVSKGQDQSVRKQKKFTLQSGLNGGFDLGVGFQSKVNNPSLTYFELKSLTRSNTLFVGWTARISSFYGQDLDYQTAPARLTSKREIDTVHFSRLAQTSFNLGVRAEWYLGRLQFGASVDLLGITFLGRPQVGQVYSSTGLFNRLDAIGQTRQTPFQGSDAFQAASPTRLNVKLWGDHERGMLTTDVYARLYIVSNVGLKLGYQWLSTEVTLMNQDVVANNARFRNRLGLAYVAVTFPINPW